MFKKRRQRIDKILASLEAKQSLHLRDAAQMLGVSEMTLRRDIAQSGHEILCLGGHLIRPDANTSSPYRLDSEEGISLQNKQAVGRLAAQQAQTGESIFIDCGTTTPHLIAALPKDVECTVICYSANIAHPLLAFPKLTLILLGGIFYPASATYYCEESLTLLKRLRINKAFLSAGGVSIERGMSCSLFHEVKVKQTVMEVATEKFLLVDSAKFERIRPAFFAEFGRIDTIVTDAGIKGEMLKRIRQTSVKLLVAPHG